MIVTPTSALCSDLLVIPLEDGLIDISWSVDTDTLKNLLETSFDKILNFQENVDFNIEIDSVNTFDSINLVSTTFSSIAKTYRGNMVFSVILPFNKNKFEETNYYLRLKINDSALTYNVLNQNLQSQMQISFEDKWSEVKLFTIPKNYTKDLIDTMYSLVADFNAYNKEAKSANMYYIFQSIAAQLNQEFTYIKKENNVPMLNKALPDSLVDSFGILFKFDNAYNLSMEEYRRIIRNLIIGYQNGGAWKYIKETLKYLFGYAPELANLKTFYPWILRKAEIIGYYTDGTPIYSWDREDPANWLDRSYFNPDSNYYLYQSSFNTDTMDKNRALLLNSGQQLFTFIVKSDNFFNVKVDEEKVKTILNLLKSAYTKYGLNIDAYVELETFEQYIFIDNNNNYLSIDEDNYIMF